MRDSNKGMIEIFGCEKEDGLYFSLIKLEWANERLALRFGITEQDYFHIKNIITFRPFENTAVGPYKYFFSGSYFKDDPVAGTSKMSVRVEQKKMNKQYDFSITNAYIANLLWFSQVKDRPVLQKFMIST